MTRVRGWRTAVVAAVAAAGMALATPQALAEPGQGVDQNVGGPYALAWYGPCGYIFDSATAGGISGDGFGAFWLFKSDPTKTPEGFSQDCTFDVALTFDVKGGPQRTERIRGDSRNIESQRAFVTSGNDESSIRPTGFTATICQQGGGCSGPLRGRS